MRLPPSLSGHVFFQNGPHPVRGGNPLDGQGHVTAIHLSTGAVSELRVPAPRFFRVTLSDMQRAPLVCLFLLLTGAPCHTGTANTAVTMRGGRLLAVEEGSLPYRLGVEGGKVVGRGWWGREKEGPHTSVEGVAFRYSPSHMLPLSVDGVPVPWIPRSRPFTVHSAVRVGKDGLLFPLMSCHLGGWREWVRGERALPLVLAEEGAAFLLLNLTTWRTTHLKTGGGGDVFHTLSARWNGSHLVAFSSYVDNLSPFLLGKGEELRFRLRKDVFHDGEWVEGRDFAQAGGDFPNHVEGNVYLVHRMREPWVVFFDVEKERVVRRVRLPTRGAHDVVCKGDHLLYCTLDALLVVSLASGRTVCRLPIPRRTTNFHALLVREEEVR